MWLNVKRAFHIAPFVRGADFNEDETMEGLIDALLREFFESFQVPRLFAHMYGCSTWSMILLYLIEEVRTEEGSQLPEGGYWDFQAFRGKSLLSDHHPGLPDFRCRWMARPDLVFSLCGRGWAAGRPSDLALPLCRIHPEP